MDEAPPEESVYDALEHIKRVLTSMWLAHRKAALHPLGQVRLEAEKLAMRKQCAALRNVLTAHKRVITGASLRDMEKLGRHFADHMKAAEDEVLGQKRLQDVQQQLSSHLRDTRPGCRPSRGVLLGQLHLLSRAHPRVCVTEMAPSVYLSTSSFYADVTIADDGTVEGVTWEFTAGGLEALPADTFAAHLLALLRAGDMGELGRHFAWLVRIDELIGAHPGAALGGALARLYAYLDHHAAGGASDDVWTRGLGLVRRLMSGTHVLFHASAAARVAVPARADLWRVAGHVHRCWVGIDLAAQPCKLAVERLPNEAAAPAAAAVATPVSFVLECYPPVLGSRTTLLDLLGREGKCTTGGPSLEGTLAAGDGDDDAALGTTTAATATSSATAAAASSSSSSSAAIASALSSSVTAAAEAAATMASQGVVQDGVKFVLASKPTLLYRIVRVPFVRDSDLSNVLAVLRRQLVFNELLQSCFGKGGGADGKEHAALPSAEVVVESARYALMVSMSHPTTQELLTFHFAVQRGGVVESRATNMFGEPPCTDADCARWAAATHSVPLTIARALRT